MPGDSCSPTGTCSRPPGRRDDRADGHSYRPGGRGGVTQSTRSRAVGGQIIGAYTVVLQPEQRQRVVAFNMP